jgi:hypothetical protein
MYGVTILVLSPEFDFVNDTGILRVGIPHPVTHTQNLTEGVHVMCPLLSDLNLNCKVSTNFSRTPNIKSRENV